MPISPDVAAELEAHMFAAAAPNFPESHGLLRLFVAFAWRAIAREANTSTDPEAWARHAVAHWQAAAREDGARRN